MLAARKELGRIDSLYTLCEHVDLRLVNKRSLESLVKAGAFDSLAEASPRRAGRGSSPRSTRPSSTAGGTSAIATRGKSQLFGVRHEGGRPGAFRCPDAAPWSEASSSPSRKRRSACT